MMKCTHIVQAVRQLNQQHPNVFGHRQQKLAQVFGLRCFLGHHIEFFDLG